MKEFVSKLGLKIKFKPAFSPWSNDINERNHYNCDVMVRKIMEEDKKVGLGEAVDMENWTHNTNVNVKGFQPLQLMTGKSVVIPGLTLGNIATDSMANDEMVRSIMERHYWLMKEFRMLEFSGKLRKANKTRSKGYEDVIIETGDQVFYQYEDKKAWIRLEKVFAVNGGDIFIFANGNLRKVPRCNVQLSEKKEEIEKDETEGSKSTVTFEEIEEKDIEEVSEIVTRSMKDAKRKEKRRGEIST